jgi:hypothetical protein
MENENINSYFEEKYRNFYTELELFIASAFIPLFFLWELKFERIADYLIFFYSILLVSAGAAVVIRKLENIIGEIEEKSDLKLKIVKPKFKILEFLFKSRITPFVLFMLYDFFYQIFLK